MDDVFEAFRNCISDGKCINKPCVYENKCQITNRKDQFIEIPKHLALDVLNRLKELTKEPAEMEGEIGSHTWWYVCGECRCVVNEDDNYCRNCGRPLIR